MRRAAGGVRRNTASTSRSPRVPRRRVHPLAGLTQPSSRCDGLSRYRRQSVAAGRLHRGPRRCRPCRCRAARAQHGLDRRNLSARRAASRAPTLGRRPACRFPPSGRSGRGGMCAARGPTCRAALHGRAPNGRPRVAPFASRRHRVHGAGEVRRRAIVHAAMTARFVVAPRETARGEPEAECAIGPKQKLAPMKTDEPRQTDDENAERRERRADMPEQVTEARRERMADRIRAGRADKRRFERATGQHRADEAKPQPDRARTAQARAARQHRLDEPPDERDEPDGRPAEPAENYRVHTRHRRMTDWRKRNPSSLNRRSQALRRRTQVCLRPRAKRTGRLTTRAPLRSAAC